MRLRIVVASGEPLLASRLQGLRSGERTCEAAQSLEEVRTLLLARGADLVVIAAELLPEEPTRSLLDLRSHSSAPEVVVLAEEVPAELQTGACGAGATVLHRQVPDESLVASLGAILDRRLSARTPLPSFTARSTSPALLEIPSASPAMKACLKVARRVAEGDSSLLILGETGVGKEWLARGIHAASRRASGPFVAVNCGAFPDALLEAELFGHERGAFTGAVRSRKGWFEVAHRGTLFLDEIGEMPLHLQVKLLRVLQDRAILSIGKESPTRVDVRVIAATNRNVAADIESGKFRTDLYYRLSVVTITIPPLRERVRDIPGLVKQFLGELRTTVSTRASDITEEAMEALKAYAWPGNVRELVNVIERSLLLSEGSFLSLEDLPESVQYAPIRDSVPGPALARQVDWPRLAATQSHLSLPRARKAIVAAFEKAYLEHLLRESGGRISETAERAGIQPRSLFNRLRCYGLRKEDYRAVRISAAPHQNPLGHSPPE